MSSPGNPGAFGADNVYVIIQPPQPVIPSGGQARNGAVVGGASWGPLNNAVACGTPAQLLSNFGPPILNNPAPLVPEGSVFLNQVPQGSVYGLRVDDGTSTAATGNLVDGTSTKLTVTGATAVAGGDVVKLDLYQAGTRITTNSNQLSYTTTAAEADTAIATALAALIVASGAPWTTLLTAASAAATGAVVSTPIIAGKANVYIVATITPVTGSTLAISNAASVQLVGTGIYNGTFGNKLVLSILAGSLPNTIRAVVQAPNANPEIWDNLPAVGSVAAVVNAINLGTSPGAPKSQFMVVAAGSDATELTVGQFVTLTGGTDGLSGISNSEYIGVDGMAGSRTGMYALQNVPGLTVFWFAGCTDSTTWSTMDVFAKQEYALAIGSLPVNTLPAAALAAVGTAGVNDPWFAIMMNHIVIFDSILNQITYLAPACILAGIICNLNPQQSPGNKTVSGIIGTDKTYGPNPILFAASDDAALESAGITYVSLPIPGANAFGIRNGKNSNSSNFATSEIAYTTLTNQITSDLQSPVLGQFVNMLQSVQANDPVREAVRNALNSYFGPKVGTVIDNFSAQCDLNNNTPDTIRAGYLYATVLVEYLSVINKFVINLTAGQTVQVTASSSPQ
jgi:hypothetical protein